MLLQLSKKETIHGCLVNTDCYIYKFTPTVPSIYGIFKRDVFEHFDTSDYPKNNVLCMKRVNKK